MKRIIITSTLIGLGFPITSSATDINVDFTARLLATTCTITIKEDGGPTVNNTGGDDYSMTIPTVGLDKIANAHADAQANFQLVAKDCSAGYSKIVTKLSGATISGNLIKNEATDTPIATNIGMGIKRRDAADAAFITPNNSVSVEWTTADKTDGMKLTVALRETTAGTGNIGKFRAKATFNFTYE
ncbi:fimbrial protein [Escherichia albertii]|uniref:Fimbrial protein n=1 Tax=Escherichia albertii TaxID=208962 RepID=A0ABX5HLP0_ESCAL|nr:fimbrial protein [Escherichia albertii]CTU50266.1 putative fimbrial protein [Escherichia coli]EEX2833435.1 fimbrial protein [Escherichia albertii]EFB1498807.1 fimbrial protein [Escherichia albertii]EFF0781225.1 fimbrial protein [Escherichia albertii]EFF0795433.1 fimbrial protein [Escherichia albertii]